MRGAGFDRTGASFFILSFQFDIEVAEDRGD
jgi:hypothetical protein